MDQDPSAFFPMNNFGQSNSLLSPFNMELLMTSIANNDSLVRSYHEKCTENGQLQQNLQSITETAQQIQQLYTIEKEQKEQLQTENADLIAKLNRVQARLEKIENEHINTETLNKQIIAELEEKCEQNNSKYLEICESFVEQANILNTNNLSTSALTRKCIAVKEVLQTNGIQFEWKSQSKQRRKSAADKVKVKSMQTIATQTESTSSSIESINNTLKPITHNKGTQYQQSKTTRSTCTSAFIQSIDASTSTDSDNDNTNIELALERMVSYPTLLSPIHESTTPKHNKATTTTCTQTATKNYRSQGTLTLINNVRKRVNYARARTKSELLYEVKKEECLSPCASPALFCSSSAQDDPAQVTTQFHHYWQMIGDLLCRMLSTPNVMAGEKHSDDIRIIQKVHEMQNLIAAGMHRKPDDHIALNGAENIDCQDEHSRDSVESYNSAKIVISKMRNLSNCSPLSLDENLCASSPPMYPNENRPNVFTPISAIAEQIEKELQENQIEVRPQIPKLPAITHRAPRRDKIEPKPPNNSPAAGNNGMDLGCSSSSTSEVIGNQQQIENEAHFKVPKRKSSTSDSSSAAKKRKPTKVSAANQACSAGKNLTNTLNFQKIPQKQQLLTSLFGDLSDDDDNSDCEIDEQIRKILESIHTPKMLSPIKDWCEDETPTVPSSMAMDAQECAMPATESGEHMNAKYEVVSNQLNANITNQQMETANTTDSLQMNQLPLQTTPNEMEPQLLALPENIVQATVTAEKQDQVLESQIECVVEHSLEPSQLFESSSNSNVNLSSCDADHSNVLNEKDTDDAIGFDDFSPASPKPEDQPSSWEVPEIPTDTMSHNNEMDATGTSHVATDSVLDQIIYNYVPSIQNGMLLCSDKFSKVESYLLASLRKPIEMHCNAKQWTSAAVAECVDRLFSLSRRPKHLATAILEVIEDTKESLSVEFTPAAPVLQPSHQKCILLVSHLTKLMPNFNQYLQFELERRLFTFNKEAKLVDRHTNLAHFYVALIDIEQPNDRSKVQLFIYKCLYYFKALSVPLIFTVIMAHQYAMPNAENIKENNDPLIRAIGSALSNIVYTNSKLKNLRNDEMYYTLRRRFGFFTDKSFAIDVAVDFCIECIQKNRLKHVDYALILLAKRKDYEYAVDEIIEKRLTPMLNQYFSMNVNATTENDGKICTILFTIGSIVKTFPIEKEVLGYLNMFVTCLNATQRQAIQEAAILAICQLNRFGTAQIYQHLANWKPNYKISAHIQAMLNTIVYKKSKQYWFGNSEISMSNQMIKKKNNNRIQTL